MKLNIPVRLKNPWFWVGLVSVALTALGLDPAALTSWQAVWDCVRAVLGNPFRLCTMVLAILAVFLDPTTAGLADSARALTYRRPWERPL